MKGEKETSNVKKEELTSLLECPVCLDSCRDKVRNDSRRNTVTNRPFSADLAVSGGAHPLSPVR